MVMSRDRTSSSSNVTPNGAFDRLGELAAELVRLNLDVIVVDGSATAKVIKALTSTGRAMLVTNPSPTGSVANAKTTGILCRLHA